MGNDCVKKKSTSFFFLHQEDEDDDDRLKRECERLFHPEKFDFHELTTSVPTIEAANIDHGALFYAQQQRRDSEPQFNPDSSVPWSWSDSVQQRDSTNELVEKRVTFEDIKSDTFHRYRKYGRSFSQQETSPLGMHRCMQHRY